MHTAFALFFAPAKTFFTNTFRNKTNNAPLIHFDKLNFIKHKTAIIVKTKNSTDFINSRLNNAVAITVVLLSVFMAVSKIKDDNIVQAMQQAKADSIDTWSEYQSKKLKLHLAESALHQAVLLQATNGTAANQSLFSEEIKTQKDAIIKYEKESAALQQKAKDFGKSYDEMNYHDDQFDMSDALLAIALAVAAVSALITNWWLLGLAWVSGGFGILFGLSGFAGWAFHPGWLAALLS